MKTEEGTEVFVENIKHPTLGIGRIEEITYDTGEALIRVIWFNDIKRQYWPEELEFILKNKN